MARRGVAGDVIRNPHQRQLDLKRRRAEQPGELGFRADLVRHEVQQADPQRPDILPDRIGFTHDQDAFGLERTAGGKIVRNCNRHFASFLGTGSTPRWLDPLGCRLGHILLAELHLARTGRLALGVFPTLDAMLLPIRPDRR